MLLLLVRNFFMLGLISFGPGMVALVHQRVVSEKKWMTEQEFRESVTFGELAPGPFTLHVVMYVGYHLAGLWGMILCVTSFILPSLIAVVIIAKSLEGYIMKIPGLENFLVGVLAAILASMVSTIIKLGEKLLRVPALVVLTIVSFIIVYAFQFSFILTILIAGLMYLITMMLFQRFGGLDVGS